MQDKPPYPPISSTKPNESPKEKKTVFQYSYPQQSETLFKEERDAPDNTSDETRTASIGRWSKEEHYKFIECKYILPALKAYGKNWKKIETYVGTRSSTQIRSHAQKFFNKLSKLFPAINPLEYLQKADIQSIVALGVEGDAQQEPSYKPTILRRERSSSCDLNTVIRPNPIKCNLPHESLPTSKINETLVDQEVFVN